MSLANLTIDTYERKARLYPVLLLVAPVAVTIVAILSIQLSAVESLGAAFIGLLIECGGAFLLSQLARDAGKNKEKMLFEKWGGMPSVAIFRHRDTRLDAITKARYHKKLATLVKGAKPPSVTDEQSAPGSADQVYIAWSTYLRVNTRDTKKYRLLFQENISYGFRRNTWGLRPVGIMTNSFCLLTLATWSYLSYQSTHKISANIVGAAICILLLLLLWVFRFSANWVRTPADAYAARLAEAIDTL